MLNPMTPADEKYLASRRLVILLWPVLALALLAATLAGFWYLWQHFPLYVNQNYLLDQLRDHKVSNQMLYRMAVMGNMAFVACGGFVLVVLVLISAALWQERRLLRIIGDLKGQLDRQAPARSEPPHA